MRTELRAPDFSTKEKRLTKPGQAFFIVSDEIHYNVINFNSNLCAI